MSTLQTVLLAMTGTVFAIWVYLLFRAVMDQRRRATMRTGQVFPGLRDALLEWGHWLTAHDTARDRRQLFILTLALVALLVLSAFSFST